MLSGFTNSSNLTASVDVVVGVTGGSPSTTPVAVRIQGTQKVGSTLTAELIDENRSLTTSAAVTYNWYRLDNSNSEFSNQMGLNKTYALTNSDLGKYIGLTATYIGGSFNAKTGIIITSSSSSNSSSSSSISSSSSSSNDQTTTATNNKQAPSADGWKENLPDWKYVKNGQPVVGWNPINSNWYLMDSTGTMQTGWKQTNGEWYYLYSDGAMASDINRQSK